MCEHPASWSAADKHLLTCAVRGQAEWPLKTWGPVPTLTAAMLAGGHMAGSGLSLSQGEESQLKRGICKGSDVVDLNSVPTIAEVKTSQGPSHVLILRD